MPRKERSGFVAWHDIVCAAQCGRGLHLQPFLIYRFQIWNCELKDFTSSQEHHLNNPPVHLPNGCCGSWSVSSSAQLVFSSFERVTTGSTKPSQCRWILTKCKFTSLYFEIHQGFVCLFLIWGAGIKMRQMEKVTLTTFFGPVSCIEEMPCLFRYSSIFSSSMESTGMLLHSFWNSANQRQFFLSRGTLIKQLDQILIYTFCLLDKFRAGVWICMFVKETGGEREGVISHDEAMLTFIYHKLAVFVIVEQDLLLIWSCHEDDLIPQSL